MKLIVKSENISDVKADVLAKPFFKDGLTESIKPLDQLLSGKIAKIINMGDFAGKEKESFTFYTDNLIKTERMLLFGFGDYSKSSINLYRKSAALIAKQCVKSKAGKICIDFSQHKQFCEDTKTDEITAFSAFIEGIILSQYKYDKYKKRTPEEIELKEVILVFPKSTDLQKYNETLNITSIICQSVYNARNFANAPGSDLNPVSFASEIKNITKKCGIKTTVLKKKEIEAKKMGGLLAVGKGSSVAPRFVILEYNIDKVEYDTIVLVGKGVTFDSGGISIKPSQSMGEMKMDMSGASAVVGAMEALSKLKIPLRIIGLLPLAENMPGGSAQRPGDIITISNGKTVEVENTDAEGRLILADALHYATKYKPKLIVDLATLTGACVVALGHLAAGVMGNDDENIKRLILSGERTNERVWQLPLYDEYAELIKSDVADIKNLGGRWGGAITAGMFLKNFVDNNPWIHIDIAGPAILEKETEYEPKGGSGYGVRLLVDFLKNWNK